jgi:hypothetical protein
VLCDRARDRTFCHRIDVVIFDVAAVRRLAHDVRCTAVGHDGSSGLRDGLVQVALRDRHRVAHAASLEDALLRIEYALELS